MQFGPKAPAAPSSGRSASRGGAAAWPSDVKGGGAAADQGALRRRAERIASPET